MRIISSTDVLRVPVERPHCHSCRRLINLAVVAASDPNESGFLNARNVDFTKVVLLPTDQAAVQDVR
jgi:hypothetical protein